MKEPLDVDPDIHRARTLPSWCYTDEAFHAQVRERVFARSWQVLGHGDDLLPASDSAHPLFLLAGCLDEPLVLTRGADGGVRVLSNVCTHRGNRVLRAPCRARHLRCDYHGRTFELDGRLRSAPGFDGAEDFPGPEDDLPAVAHGTLGPLLFAALDPVCSFEDWIGGVRSRVGWALDDGLTFDEGRSRTYEVAANWALYVDNYLEGLHIPFVHAGLNAALDFGSYEVKLERYGSVQIGIASSADATLELPADAPERDKHVAAYYFWLFPNLMLNVYSWGVNVNVVAPLSARHTRVSFLAFVRDESKLDDGAGADLHRVELEDEAIVEACQSGMQSRLYRRGRYAPKHERGVHHFHRMLATSLDASNA